MSVDRRTRLQLLFSLAAGTLFGLGLAVSQMVNPAKVLAFLDIAGDWDPTLAFVMLGALAVTAPAFRGVLRRPRPWFAEMFSMPTRRDVDAPLLIGAVLFGVGWGLAGLCPGPALAALAGGHWKVILFVAAMIAGALAHRARGETWTRPATSTPG